MTLLSQNSILGQINPQKPQIFRPIHKHQGRKLQKYDVLEVICDYINSSENLVGSGPRRTDEMCAAYLLYYVETTKSIDPESYCIGGNTT